jgi:hypothetical protein
MLDGDGGKNPPMAQDGGGIVLDAGGGDDGSMQDGGTCQVRSIPAAPIAAEIVLLVDHSGSMIDTISGNTTKWSEESGAVKAFAMETGSARQYGAMIVHPAVNVADVCAAASYSTPSVAPASFSANQSKIATVLGSITPDLSSPWSTAVKAGLDLAKSEQMMHADRKVATVFMADDTPTDCSTDIQNQIVPIVQGYSEPMYVIGMSWYSTDQAGFDALAKAGKTDTATFLLGTAITQNAIKAQLDKVRDSIGCDVAVPMDMGMAIDPAKYDFEVEYQGTRLKAATVANAGACTSGPQAWTRDSSHVVLCPQACKMLDDAQTKVRFLSRCP